VLANRPQGNGSGQPPWRVKAGGRSRTPPNFPTLIEVCHQALTPRGRAELAQSLGLPEAALETLQVGYQEQGPHSGAGECWTFAEVDGKGQVVGITCRYRDGQKKAWPGGKRGLIVPKGWDHPTDGPVLLPEGPSDVLAGSAIGLPVVGRPNNTAGIDLLAELLKDFPADRRIVVLGELDPKSHNGTWPGRDGAVKVASELAERLGRSVSWALPPDGAKDLRAWVNGLDLDPACSDSWSEASDKFLAWVEENHHPITPGGVLPEIDPDDVAGLEDLARAGSEIRWEWEKWIQRAVLTVIAAEAGVGKTRFCADLVRRIRHQLPWPDDMPMTLPPDSQVLWVVSDNHHDELVTLAQAFGIADVVRINASKSDPYGGTTLDTQEELQALEARIRAVKPALVIVDTVGNATDKDLCRQEEAKQFFQPLQLIARRCDVAILCLTHLNLSGGVLGRRPLEKVRLAIRIENPDPESQPNRRRLEVTKSNSKKPSPLGVTMGDLGNQYDANPPSYPEKESRSGPVPVKLEQCVEWLRKHLSLCPKPVRIIRTEAEKVDFSANTLYRAKDKLGVEEFEAEKKKWWKLVDNASEG
jgi:hypothetical protein